jgi:hypothetical protein
MPSLLPDELPDFLSDFRIGAMIKRLSHGANQIGFEIGKRYGDPIGWENFRKCVTHQYRINLKIHDAHRHSGTDRIQLGFAGRLFLRVAHQSLPLNAFAGQYAQWVYRL